MNTDYMIIGMLFAILAEMESYQGKHFHSAVSWTAAVLWFWCGIIYGPV